MVSTPLGAVGDLPVSVNMAVERIPGSENREDPRFLRLLGQVGTRLKNLKQ